MEKKFTNYDFSRPRVRKNGIVLDKFALARELDSFCPLLHWRVFYDTFTYVELREQLIRYIYDYSFSED